MTRHIEECEPMWHLSPDHAAVPPRGHMALSTDLSTALSMISMAWRKARDSYVLPLIEREQAGFLK
jgi:hypothetical protein